LKGVQAGKSRLIAQLQEACGGDPNLLKARLAHFALERAVVGAESRQTSKGFKHGAMDRVRVEALVGQELVQATVNGLSPLDVTCLPSRST